MDLRNQVKHALRMCGHAIVSTVHDRLNVIDRVLQDILDQNTHIASTQTALLQSSVHQAEHMARVHTEIQEAEVRLAAQLRDHSASKADLEALAIAVAEMREFSAGKVEFQALRERIAVLQDILEQNTDIAGTQTALLQSSVHLVDHLAQLQADVQQVEARIAAQVREYCANRADVQALTAALTETRLAAAAGIERQFRDGLSAIERAQEAGVGVVQSGVEKMLSLSEAMRHATAESLARLEPVAHETSDFLANQSVRQVCVETSDYFFTNPELGLFSFLYSYLPARTVFDIGAHIGDVSEHLLNVGYEVYAFEPYLQSFNRLQERLGTRPEFHAFNWALGSVTGELPLYVAADHSPDKRYEDPTVFHSLTRHGMPAELSFHGTVPVTIKKLSELHKEGVVPADAGLVKIDTEGYDLEVIRGMDGYRYPVVMVEYWDTQIPFAKQGLLYTADSMAYEMRQRGYLWYIVIYRVWGQNQTAFYCNHDRAVPGSWGNMLFFRQHDIFVQAQHWCSAVLPRTYFKHVAADNGRLSARA